MSFNPKGLTYDSSASTKLVHWNESVDLCQWEGLKCNSNSRVSGLDLSGESISAGIDDTNTLFKLTHLQSLSLGSTQNGFDSVELSSQFGRLIKLRYLNLSNSGFSSQIPLSSSNLTRLVVLDLSNKYYSSLTLENPDLGRLVRNLTSLRELYLDIVKISADGNDWSSTLSSHLPNLRVLSLSDAHLPGPPGSSLLKLQSLSVIRLDGNAFSSPFSSFFADFSNLKVFSISYLNLNVLNLGSNRLRGEIGHESLWKGLDNLEFLDFSENLLQGELPLSLLALPQLKTLLLFNNTFSGSTKVSTNTSSPLEYADLSNNALEGSIPQIFFQMQNLYSLSLSSNKLSGSLRLSDFSKLTNLASLDLPHNKLSIHVEERVQLSKLFPLLETLMLASCNLYKILNLQNHHMLDTLFIVTLILNQAL
ncbi:receptor-like protein 6 [Salvia hispanica]|uniref:receptor-like protein 6 n=1 Tax=Salvia hispanica TaxID=49212 RepID=UPI0020093970|nr:receptor-like protein 6 [Salvia hispanica]